MVCLFFLHFLKEDNFSAWESWPFPQDTQNMDCQEASRKIITRMIDLDCASTPAQARCICFLSTLGIPPSLTLPPYLKLHTIPGHGHAFMLARLNVLSSAELRGRNAKIPFTKHFYVCVSGVYIRDGRPSFAIL